MNHAILTVEGAVLLFEGRGVRCSGWVERSKEANAVLEFGHVYLGRVKPELTGYWLFPKGLPREWFPVADAVPVHVELVYLN